MTKRRQPGLSVKPEAIVPLDCLEDCNGACCKADRGIPLSEAERNHNLLSMQVKTKVRPEPYDRVLPALSKEESEQLIPAGVGFYVLIKDCGHLAADGTCGVYDEATPKRPSACQRLVPGSIACLIDRALEGYSDALPVPITEIVNEAVERQQTAQAKEHLL